MFLTQKCVRIPFKVILGCPKASLVPTPAPNCVGSPRKLALSVGEANKQLYHRGVFETCCFSINHSVLALDASGYGKPTTVNQLLKRKFCSPQSQGERVFIVEDVSVTAQGCRLSATRLDSLAR